MNFRSASEKNSPESPLAVCIIPARSGSKRIVDKNIKSFLGKPMIHYAIETAIESDLFDEIIISTDSERIAKIALQPKYSRLRVSFRPGELASDTASTIDVIRYVGSGYKINTQVCCLYPATPLLLPEHLIESKKFLDHYDFVIPYSPYSHPVERAIRLNPEGQLSLVRPDSYFKRTQETTSLVHDAGCFYWGTVNSWASYSSPYDASVIGYSLPRHRSVDIDTEEDWVFAETIYKGVRA